MKAAAPTTAPVFRDKAGRKVQAGNVIVYGHALGRCAGLRYAKVLGVVWSGQPVNLYDGTGNEAHAARLRVHGVDDDWAHNAPKLLSKPSILSFGSRVLVLTADQVPGVIASLLAAVQP